MTQRRRNLAAAREYDRTQRKDTAWRKAQRTGYRTDSARHVKARWKVPKARRVAIAKAGAAVRNALTTRQRRAIALKGWATRRNREQEG